MISRRHLLSIGLSALLLLVQLSEGSARPNTMSVASSTAAADNYLAGPGVTSYPPMPAASSRIGTVPESVPGQLAFVRFDPNASPYNVPAPPQARLGIRSTIFTVNWNSGECLSDGSGATLHPWPPAAQAAFNYAVSIWASLIASPVPITVDACWWSTLNGALGSGGPSSQSKNFPSAPLPDTWYPAALANALSGSDIVAGSELRVNFNGSSDWYFGTDGLTGGKLDFATVALHEVTHGLGFIGYLESSYNIGFCANAGFVSPYCPSPYDRFATDENGVGLLSYLPLNPDILGAKLTSNAFFAGPNAVAQNDGLVRLYTPSTWNPGSSYSHLDESFNGTPNALMTYAVGTGEALHNPGPVTLGIFRDMGLALAGSWPRVELSGPTSGTAYTGYGFTANFWPITTSQQITYTWSASDLAGTTHTARGISDTAFFTWTTPGEKRVVVTASGVGIPVSATHTVMVDPGPQTGVSLSGPTLGTVNTSYAYTATFSPLTTKQPLNYSWTASGLSPVVHSGKGVTDTVSLSWPTPGDKAITVTVTGFAGPVSKTVSVNIVPILDKKVFIPIAVKP